MDSDASTSSCPPPAHEPSPPSEHGIQTTTSSCNMHEYFARKMAALQQARIAKLMQDPDEVTVAVKEVDMFVSPLPFPPLLFQYFLPFCIKCTEFVGVDE